MARRDDLMVEPRREVGGITESPLTQARADESGRREAQARTGIVRLLQDIAAPDLGLLAATACVAERVLTLVGATGCELELLEGDAVVCCAAAGRTARTGGETAPLAGSLTQQAAARGDGVLVDEPAGARIVVPLHAGERTVGALLALADRPGAFSQRDLDHLQIVAESFGATVERHRIAGRLHESETQYRMLFLNNPQPMWVYEVRSLRFLAVNRAAVQHYGYSEAEFMAMPVRALWLEQDVAEMERFLQSTVYQPRNEKMPRCHRCRDGTLIDVEVSADDLVFDGRPARLVLVNDVTERLRTERELARLSRAQHMLGACNEMLIRASSEDALLDEICRIAVEIGGYRMAWIGFANDDAAKSIVTVAHAGADADYMKDAVLSWADDSVFGQGPASRTVRSAQAVIVEDIASDEAFQPWIGEALASGFRSVVSLPLRAKGLAHAFGLLYLYAPDVSRLSPDEVKLLGEMADNLAFGITSLRSQAAERRIQAAVLKVGAAVSKRSGAEFFEQLVRNMAESLGAQAGFAARLVPGRPLQAQTVARVHDGAPQGDVRYLLDGSPDAQLLDAGSVVLPAQPGLQHPLAAGLGGPGFSAYVGQRLDNSAGEPIGLLFVLFREPLAQTGFIVSTLQIFAARAAAEMERQEADARLRDQASLLDKAQDAIIVRSMEHRVLFWNQSAERLYGWTAAEAVGSSIPELLYRDRAAFFQATGHVLASREWTGEIEQYRKDGTSLTVEGRWTLVTDERGNPQSILAIETDITRRKAAEVEVQKLAFYDPLTGLPNRLLLTERLTKALAVCARNRRTGALLFIDLDNFKTLNDTLGHDRGDLLLRQVGQRLAGCVREADTVSRLGGDEFLVMLEELSEHPEEAAHQARGVGEKILAALNRPYRLGDYEHLCTSSIGIAPFSDPQLSVGELLKQADLAMYQAKSAGRNTMRFFDPAMQAVVTARASLEADLRLALAQQEFVLHYQPQADAAGRLIGVEALVRWQHGLRGMVSPAHFIPLAEETGVILPLGQWVLETACAQLAAWAAMPQACELSMSVNVSSRQFRHPDFVEQVLAALARSGADPRRLKLELTESLLVDDVDLVIAKMNVLKAHGVGFSLDDFGTGYSSLAYLKRMPLDQLKIDQGFVREVLVDPNDAAIARTIIALGQSLGLAVVAEGVETEAQRAFLMGQGCSAYQGYLLSRPVEAETLMAFLAKAAPLVP